MIIIVNHNYNKILKKIGFSSVLILKKGLIAELSRAKRAQRSTMGKKMW